jgi:hypothetical protein
MSVEQTLVADGDKDDYIVQGITHAEVHANLGDLDLLRVNGPRLTSEKNASYAELTRLQLPQAIGWVALQRPRTVTFEDN